MRVLKGKHKVNFDRAKECLALYVKTLHEIGFEFQQENDWIKFYDFRGDECLLLVFEESIIKGNYCPYGLELHVMEWKYKRIADDVLEFSMNYHTIEELHRDMLRCGWLDDAIRVINLKRFQDHAIAFDNRRITAVRADDKGVQQKTVLRKKHVA